MANIYSKLRVGIAGAGLMGHWHAKSAHRIGAKVISVLDHDLSRAKDLSVGFDTDPVVLSNLEELLKQSKPDILHICTPIESHYAIALQAIERGVHVIIEKPLTVTAVETKNLLSAAQNNGVSVCPVHQFGFQRGVKQALNELDSLGDSLELRFTICSAGGQGQKKSDLNRVVADIIPHPLSVIRKLQPGINLNTSNWRGVHSRDGELQVIGSADGIAIDISISMNARPTRCELDVFCSKGRIYLNFFHGYAVIEKGRVSRTQKLLQPFKYAVKEFFSAGSNITRRGLSGAFAYPGLKPLLELFYCSVIEGTAPPISAEDTLDVATAHDELTSRFLPGRTYAYRY